MDRRQVTEATARRTMILLVDNSDSDADFLELMLENAAPSAFEIARTTTLAEAASYLEARRADCVVVDLGLPDAESLGAIETLSGSSPAVAVLVLTDGEDDGLGMGAIETIASDYLSKRMLEGRLLVSSIRFAILRKRLEILRPRSRASPGLGAGSSTLATNRVSWSRELCRLFGLGPDEAPTTAALIDRTHPDDRESGLLVVRATIEEYHSVPLRDIVSCSQTRRCGGSAPGAAASSAPPADLNVCLAWSRTSRCKRRPKTLWPTRHSMTRSAVSKPASLPRSAGPSSQAPSPGIPRRWG